MADSSPLADLRRRLALAVGEHAVFDGWTAKAVNSAAETFLNLSSRSLVGKDLLDRLSIDAPVADALLRVRRHLSPIFIAEADLTTGEKAPVQCGISLSPL